MLRSIGEIIGYEVKAKHEVFGKVSDFYLDDAAWSIRYMVVDSGTWLSGREVLISPSDIGQPDPFRRIMPVSLTRDQVESGPPAERDMPVSRRHELEVARHYKWMTYWGPMAGESPALMVAPVRTEVEEEEQLQGDPHLQSVKELKGYHIRATDRGIGHVVDFIADIETWEVRYMVIDTRNWLPGRKVLVSPAWVTDVKWAERKVHVDVSSDAIRHSPEFAPTAPVNRQYEVRLYDYYGRPRYWQKPKGRG